MYKNILNFINSTYKAVNDYGLIMLILI